MPNLNPLEPGDVPYPQYSITTTQDILDTVIIIKGDLYGTVLGKLQTPTGGPLDFETGLFQARESAVPSPSVDGDKVQVLSPGSRMILRASSNMHKGRTVVWDDASKRVTPGNKSDLLYVGRVIEIYTKDDDGNTKILTAVDDLVIVETYPA